MPYRVDIIESERGWGTKVDESIYFHDKDTAWAYEKQYNSKNPPGPAPDWYMQAEDPVYVETIPAGARIWTPRYANDN